MGLNIDIDRTSVAPPVSFDTTLIDSIRNAAKELGIPHIDMFSAAGHDACKLAEIAPTAMIFVPCEKGISHNELENATPEDLAAGTQVLFEVILEAANS